MDVHQVTTELWAGLDGNVEALSRLTTTGPAHVLPSVFPVTGAATASVALATLGTSELWCCRGATPSQVAVDARHAALACRSERLLQAVDQDLGDLWDELSGVYAASDGWIRLHTNFTQHRLATLDALGLGPAKASRALVGQAVARRPAVELEDAIYAAGGCAGALRTREEWRGSTYATVLADEPLIGLEPLAGEAPEATEPSSEPPSRPLSGLKVLDLSRVIAGPVAGRFLAAYGADVLRIDAPDGEDGALTVADTITGKRSAFVDLRTPAGRSTFDQLVAGAHVVLCAYRPGALEGMGYGPAELAGIRPGLVVGTLSAYGQLDGTGVPWGSRRGFDSLVQMVTGLASEGCRAVDADHPVPLPAQLLDHVSGYLLAAGVVAGLARQRASGSTPSGYQVKVSLARTSLWLDDLGRGGVIDMEDPADELPEDLTVDLHGPLGHTRHVACPGMIVGAAPHWSSGPVPLGFHTPTW